MEIKVAKNKTIKDKIYLIVGNVFAAFQALLYKNALYAYKNRHGPVR